MDKDSVQLTFIKKDEYSKKLGNISIELINFGEFIQGDKRIIRNDMLNNFKLTVIKKGECCIYNKDKRIHMKAHDAVLVSPFGFYSAECISEEPIEFYFIRFNIDHHNEHLDFMTLFHLSGINTYVNCIGDDLLNEFDLVNEEMKQAKLGYFFHIELLLKKALLSMLRTMTYENEKEIVSLKNSAEEKMIIDCVMYLDEHIHENIRVDDLCSHFNVSQSYLYRCFQNTLQISTKEFINRYRMKFICSDLKYTSLSIKEISVLYNYPSSYAFTNAFKAMFSLSPSEYRNSKKI